MVGRERGVKILVRWACGAALALVLVACSSSASEPCEVTEDCFQGETCDDGFCRENADPGGEAPGGGDAGTSEDTGSSQDTGSSEDTGTSEDTDSSEDVGSGGDDVGSSEDVGSSQGDAGSQDGGGADVGAEQDAGHDAGDGPACPAQFPCDSGLDESVTTPTGYVIEPEAGDESAFGCAMGQSELIDDVPAPLEVQSCSGSLQRFRTYGRHCEGRDFVIEVEISPIEPACPLDEVHLEESWFVVEEFPFCESASEGNCRTEEFLENGGIRWAARFSGQSHTATRAVRFALEAGADYSFPYQVELNVY